MLRELASKIDYNKSTHSLRDIQLYNEAFIQSWFMELLHAWGMSFSVECMGDSGCRFLRIILQEKK